MKNHINPEARTPRTKPAGRLTTIAEGPTKGIIEKGPETSTAHAAVRVRCRFATRKTNYAATVVKSEIMIYNTCWLEHF